MKLADNDFTNGESSEKKEHPEYKDSFENQGLLDSETHTEELEEFYSDLFQDDYEDTEEDYEDPQSKWGWRLKVAAVFVLVAFVAFSFLDFSYLFSGKLSFLNQNLELSEDEIVLLCKPAVVSIEAGTKRGTGFNISPNGTIITNEHVVADATTITISFGDGRVFYTNTYQVVPDVDVAILNINGDVRDLPFIELNKEEQVGSGDVVTIIGNPLGFPKISQRGSVGKFYKLADSQAKVFDIDISINPGNSGSPVLNGNGQAVGVVFASMSENNGDQDSIALAVPAQFLP